MSILYQDAVNCLRSRLRPFRSNPTKNRPNNMYMKEWLSELGCKNPSALNIIHITGKKGKGSTAAFTDASIRAHSRHLLRPIKVGLYTSPHLATERERIRINFQPISEELFTTAFFEVWDTLCKNVSDDRMPGYLQLLALSQRENASLAIQLANAYLGLHGGELSRRDIVEGASLCKWPGRFQTVSRGSTLWFLDCAHNSLSIPVALSWFISEVQSTTAHQYRGNRRILIFGHESARNTHDLISLIAEFCLEETFHFDLVILSPYERYGQKVQDSMIVEEHARFWQAIQPSAQLARALSIKQAIDMAEEHSRRNAHHILITGSIYLVGQALTLLEKKSC